MYLHAFARHAALAAALTALVDVTLAVDEHAPCVDAECTVPGCCGAGADA
mgnify:CR=1 FL=1